MAATSMGGTIVLAGSGGVIVDASGNKWTISPQFTVLKNARLAGFTANVAEIAYVSSLVWHENTSGQWYSWNGSAWISGADPLSTILDEILSIAQQILTETLATKQEIATMSDAVQTELASIQTAVTGVAASVTAIMADATTIAAEIAALQAAASSTPDTLAPETQAMLDSLAAAAASLQTNAAAAQLSTDALANPPVATPAPTPDPSSP